MTENTPTRGPSMDEYRASNAPGSGLSERDSFEAKEQRREKLHQAFVAQGPRYLMQRIEQLEDEVAALASRSTEPGGEAPISIERWLAKANELRGMTRFNYNIPAIREAALFLEDAYSALASTPPPISASKEAAEEAIWSRRDPDYYDQWQYSRTPRDGMFWRKYTFSPAPAQAPSSESDRDPSAEAAAQGIPLAIPGSGGWETVPSSAVKASGFNDWWLSLPEGRRAVLIDDKWMLAQAAFDAPRSEPRAPVLINGKPPEAVALIDALIDIYDDAQQNPPESRQYVESAWSDIIEECRQYLAALAASTTQPPATKDQS